MQRGNFGEQQIGAASNAVTMTTKNLGPSAAMIELEHDSKARYRRTPNSWSAVREPE